MGLQFCQRLLEALHAFPIYPAWNPCPVSHRPDPYIVLILKELKESADIFTARLHFTVYSKNAFAINSLLDSLQQTLLKLGAQNAITGSTGRNDKSGGYSRTLETEFCGLSGDDLPFHRDSSVQLEEGLTLQVTACDISRSRHITGVATLTDGYIPQDSGQEPLTVALTGRVLPDSSAEKFPIVLLEDLIVSGRSVQFQMLGLQFPEARVKSYQLSSQWSSPSALLTIILAAKDPAGLVLAVQKEAGQ